MLHYWWDLPAKVFVGSLTDWFCLSCTWICVYLNIYICLLMIKIVSLDFNLWILVLLSLYFWVFVSISKDFAKILHLVRAIKWCNIWLGSAFSVALSNLLFILLLFFKALCWQTCYTWIRRAGTLSGYKNRVTVCNYTSVLSAFVCLVHFAVPPKVKHFFYFSIIRKYCNTIILKWF